MKLIDLEHLKPFKNHGFQMVSFVLNVVVLQTLSKMANILKKQCFLCKNCNSTFTCTKDTILHGTHKFLEIWKLYLSFMSAGMSIRKSAKVCGISVPAAFYWRHKILDTLRTKLDLAVNRLSGIVESDGTYFQHQISIKETLIKGSV